MQLQPGDDQVSLSYVVGVDGCSGGWIAASKRAPGTDVCCRRIKILEDLFADTVTPRVIAVDVPIGLLERGARACDVAARRLLGPRRSSVFTAPIRPMLAATSRTEASQARRRVDGKGVTIQAWAIVPKILEVDGLLRVNPSRREIIREVHPELCFFYLNRERPMSEAKKKTAGRTERVSLLRAWCGEAIDRALAERAKLGCEADDIVDAFVALWTAERISRGDAVSIPAIPPLDAHGLRMEMVA
jgi:predicted RNase H-like nuclease